MLLVFLSRKSALKNNVFCSKIQARRRLRAKALYIPPRSPRLDVSVCVCVFVCVHVCVRGGWDACVRACVRVRACLRVRDTKLSCPVVVSCPVVSCPVGPYAACSIASPTPQPKAAGEARLRLLRQASLGPQMRLALPRARTLARRGFAGTRYYHAWMRAHAMAAAF